MSHAIAPSGALPETSTPTQLHFNINLPDNVGHPELLQGGSIAYKFLHEMRIALNDVSALLGAGEPSFTTKVVYPKRKA